MNERDIFFELLDLPAAERTEYLNRACDGKPELRAKVEALLAAHEKSGNFLNAPADPNHTRHSPDADDNRHFETELSFLQPPGKAGSLGRLAHYECLEILGRGGFGIVFKAFDEKLHRVVAIKVLNPHLAATSPPRKRFLREARAAAAIKHENVVAVFAVEEMPIPHIVMEFISGESLQQHIDRTGPLELPEILRFSKQIALGLEAAHATGLIHRDIKPGNILLEAGPEAKVKITDFGLARAADDASLTQSGVICGTPMYMSPEQAMGQPIDPRSDLFSLGSVMYVMCSGRPPFRAESALAVMKRVTDDDPRPICEIVPDFPEWMCDLIGTLHEKEPDDRFESAAEVVEALEAAEVNPPRRPFRTRAAQTKSKGKWSWVTILLVVLLVGFGCLLIPCGVMMLYFVSSSSVVEQRPAVAVIEGGNGATQVMTGERMGDPVPIPPVPADFTNAIGMKFKRIPKGKGWLGGGGGKVGPDEIEVKDDFQLGQFEVTQGEWNKLMPSTPSDFSRTGSRRQLAAKYSNEALNSFPVENVSWDDCQKFIERLNERCKEPGWTHRLPTSREWEYACRCSPLGNAGKSAFNFYLAEPADRIFPTQANYAARNVFHPLRVGLFAPNKLGLYDMHGNVAEWCHDNDQPEQLGVFHKSRGGHFNDQFEGLQASKENWWTEEERSGRIGFRVARVQAETATEDQDERAAKFVLSLGGKVVRDEKLPGNPVIEVNLAVNNKLTDEGLKQLAGLKGIKRLSLFFNGKITDAGIKHLKGLTTLEELTLNNTGIGDEGLAELKANKGLKKLLLAGAVRLTDASAKTISGFTELTDLSLPSSITNEGVANLVGLKKLKMFYLGGSTAIGDGAVKAVVENMPELESLEFGTFIPGGNRITEASLLLLAKLKKLKSVDLTGAKLTAEAVKKLQTALPACSIAWSEPKK